ncbi:hypothetical protein J6590_105332, partial [Homalodisca vitripennis]
EVVALGLRTGMLWPNVTEPCPHRHSATHVSGHGGCVSRPLTRDRGIRMRHEVENYYELRDTERWFLNTCPRRHFIILLTAFYSVGEFVDRGG